MPTYIITDNTTAQNATGTQYTGVVDNKIKDIAATTNNGSVGDVEINKYDSGDHSHGLYRFDGLSSISASETVTSATLYLYQTNNGGGTYSIDLRRVLQAWTESGSTWNTYDGTNAWNTGGCLGAGTDRNSTIEATTSVGSTNNTWYSWSITSLVSDIVDGTISSDEGFPLERGDAGNDLDFKYFASCEATDGQRPELVVVTTTGGATNPKGPLGLPLNGPFGGCLG